MTIEIPCEYAPNVEKLLYQLLINSGGVNSGAPYNNQDYKIATPGNDVVLYANTIHSYTVITVDGDGTIDVGNGAVAIPLGVSFGNTATSLFTQNINIHANSGQLIVITTKP